MKDTKAYNRFRILHRVSSDTLWEYAFVTRYDEANPREYIGNLEYENGELSRINTPYGYYNAVDSTFYGYLTDRQGNIRVVYTPSDSIQGTFDVIQSTSYYPYGMPIAASTGADKNRYKYSGKEFETRFGFNLYDFHARPYDPATLLFTGIDPKAPDYPSLSPYLYCAANPLLYVDPTGEEIGTLIEDITHYYNIEEGAFFDGEGNKYDGDDKNVGALTEALNTLCSEPFGRSIVRDIVNDSRLLEIKFTDNHSDNSFNTDAKNGVGTQFISWNIYDNFVNGIKSFISLGHELLHARFYFSGQSNGSAWLRIRNGGELTEIPVEEIHAVRLENFIRIEHGFNIRFNYIFTPNIIQPGYSKSNVYKDRESYINLLNYNSKHNPNRLSRNFNDYSIKTNMFLNGM